MLPTPPQPCGEASPAPAADFFHWAEDTMLWSGEIDYTAVSSSAGRAVATGPVPQAVHLSAVTLLDSAGLGLLIQLHKRAQAAGATSTVHNPSRLARRVLELTGISGMIPIQWSARTRAGDPIRSQARTLRCR